MDTTGGICGRNAQDHQWENTEKRTEKGGKGSVIITGSFLWRKVCYNMTYGGT